MANLGAVRKALAGPRALPMPLLIAMFTFKGGAGKTTLTILLASILAKLGFNVIVVDADRQANSTTFFQEDPGIRKRRGLVDTEIDAKQAAEILLDLQVVQQQIIKENQDSNRKEREERHHQLLEEQAAKQYGTVPDIQGDYLDPNDKDAMTSNYLIPQQENTDTVTSAIRKYFFGDDSGVILKQVQACTYTGKDGTGKIFLLPGSHDLGDITTELTNKGLHRATCVTAFRNMLHDAAKQYKAQFVLVDMGPSTDIINQTFSLSCDIIQPCACSDTFSWSGATELLIEVLPKWLSWYMTYKEEEKIELRKKANDPSSSRTAPRPFNKSFPRIMPFMGMQYCWDPRKKEIQWSDANLIHTLIKSIKELWSLAKDRELENKAAGIVGEASDSEDSEDMRHWWLDHLKCKQDAESDYARRLHAVFETMFVQTASKQVVVPLLRRFANMPVSHEVGRAMFDITKKDLSNYYYPVGDDDEEIDKQARKEFVDKAYAKVFAEGQVMETRLLSLANVYTALLKQHNANAEVAAGGSNAGVGSSGQDGAAARGVGGKNAPGGQKGTVVQSQPEQPRAKRGEATGKSASASKKQKK